MTSAKIRPLGWSLFLILANVQLQRLFLLVLRFNPPLKSIFPNCNSIQNDELRWRCTTTEMVIKSYLANTNTNFVVCKVCYIKNILAALNAMDPDLPQAQNMGIRSPMSEGSPNSVL